MKRIILLASLLVVIATIGLLNYTNSSSQDNITFKHKTDSVGPFPFFNGLVNIGENYTFLLDSGSGQSTISHATLQRLKDEGYRVDSAFCPVLWRGPRGGMHFSTRRYSVDLPVGSWTMRCTPEGRIFYARDNKINNVIENVNFVLSPFEIDVIGIDLLKKFAVEFKLAESTITFYTKRPAGYEKLTDMTTSHNPLSILGCGDRYYMEMEVSGNKEDYCIDTSLDLIHAKCPASDSIYASSLQKYPVISPKGYLMNTIISEGEWAKVGNRAGRLRMAYFDEAYIEDYAVNPFKFSSQDIVLDFPNREICCRPHYDIEIPHGK